MISVRLSWPNIIATCLAVIAFVMDQTLWVWSGQLQAVCHNGANPHGTVLSNLFFAAPFLMLLFGQILLWQLPKSGARDKFYLILGAVLLAYIVFSAIEWHETAYLNASAEELSSCLYDVMDGYDFVPSALHFLLWLPCGIFLVAAIIAASRHRLNRMVGESSTDSPR